MYVIRLKFNFARKQKIKHLYYSLCTKVCLCVIYTSRLINKVSSDFPNKRIRF